MTREEQFEAFWRSYPRRIGKGAARNSFVRAIAKTTLENMQRAIQDYIDNKPAYQDFKHPSTWLNQECWDDEWALPPQPIRRPSPRPMSDFMRGQIDIKQQLESRIYGGQDEFAGAAIDITSGNYRPH